MNRATAGLLALALAAGIAVAAGPANESAASATTAMTTAPYCGISWGSLPKQNSNTQAVGALQGVRAGRHDCFDRLVFDLGGPSMSYRVQYVDQVLADPSGQPVALRGGAFLQIVFTALLYDENGSVGYQPPNRSEVVNVTGFQTFRQLAEAECFEGQITMGLGVRARLPFRVFTLDGPGTGSRLVIDVAHRW